MTIDSPIAPHSRSPWRRPKAVIFVVALVVRLIAAVVWWPDTQTDPDTYVGLARNVASGVGFCTPGTDNPTAYRPPVYPLMLATLVDVPGFRGGLAVPLWNILFDAATIGFVWSRLRFTSESMWGARTAVFVLAVDPLMVRYVALPMTELCFTCWSTAGLLLLSNLDNWRPSGGTKFDRYSWGFAGALLGVAALCRPSIWPFIAVFIGGSVSGTVWSAERRRELPKRLRELAAFGLGIGIIVSPWVLRNTLVLGRPILTTTHGGYTLLLGNNPVFYDEVARQPWGTVWSGDSLERWQRKMLADMDADLGPDADESAKDRWQANRAWEHIAADPTGFFAATWYRLRSFWSLAPRGADLVWVSWLVGLWYGAVFAAAAVGLAAMLWQRTSGTWVLLAYVAALQGVHLVYWTDARMRMPVHPVLAVFVAATVNALMSQRRRGSC